MTFLSRWTSDYVLYWEIVSDRKDRIRFISIISASMLELMNQIRKSIRVFLFTYPKDGVSWKLSQSSLLFSISLSVMAGLSRPRLAARSNN